MKEKTTQLIRIPKELHLQLKTVAQAEGLNMVQLIQKMLLYETSIIFKPEIFSKLPEETQLRLRIQLAQTDATLKILKGEKP